MIRGSEDLIVKYALLGQRPGEGRFTITIEIGRPLLGGGESPTEWACYFRVDPFYGREAHGEGPLQALCLAVQMVRTALNQFQEDGGAVFFDTGEPFEMQAFWPDKPY